MCRAIFAMILSSLLVSCTGAPFGSLMLSQSDSTQEMERQVHQLRMELNGINEELRQLTGRGEVQEDLLCTLRQELETGDKGKGWEARLAKLEKSQNGMKKEMAKLRTSTEQAIQSLSQQDKKLRAVEGNIDKVVAAVKQFADAPSLGEDAYTVRSGDTLGEIAKHHGLTVARLKQVNHLSNDRIYVGQRLKVQ